MKEIIKYFLQETPKFLTSKYQLIATVLFTALFSSLSLIVIIPFSQNSWFRLGASRSSFYTLCFFIICFVIVSISKKLMYEFHSRYSLKNFQYILWCICECIIISSLYVVVTILGVDNGLIFTSKTNISYLYGISLIYVFVTIIIPYLIAGMYFAIIDKNNTIRLINYNNVISDKPKEGKGDFKVTLFDNNGVLKLSVDLANLYFIESNDNYVIVWYSDSNHNLTKYMIRCRLKSIEESFKNTDLVRCHRKYIVNLHNVKVLTKQKDGYEIQFKKEGSPLIPVTKTYLDNVLYKFNKE